MPSLAANAGCQDAPAFTQVGFQFLQWSLDDFNVDVVLHQELDSAIAILLEREGLTNLQDEIESLTCRLEHQWILSIAQRPLRARESLMIRQQLIMCVHEARRHVQKMAAACERRPRLMKNVRFWESCMAAQGRVGRLLTEAGQAVLRTVALMQAPI